MKRISALFLLLLAAPILIFSATYTSYTSWYDENPTGTKCFLSIYCLQNNTDISLYRVATEDTTIGTLVNTWTGVAAGTPIHPVAMDPTGATGYGNSFFRLVATNSTAPAGSSFVNWEVESADEGGWPDWHTFIISSNGTFLGTQFYTYLFYDTGNSGSNIEGNSMAIINPGTASINVAVERWTGAAWVAAPATGSGASTGTIPAGQIWMYGGVTAANSGDFRVTTTGNAILWKGDALETDNDNFYTVGPSDAGSKIGKTIYGMAATAANYGSNPGAIVVTGIGGAATYDIYYYSYNTGVPQLPSTTGGTWTRLIGGETVGAAQAKSYSFGMAGTPSGPSGSRGVFIKVVVTAGAQIQVESGQNILTGVSGDGDFLVAADTGRALGTEFYPTNGNNSSTLGVGGNRDSKIIVIAPFSGTSVQVASPGLGTLNWTSTGDHQAHSFNTDYTEDATNPLNRVYTVTSSRPVYCFYETAGFTGYGMEKGYSSVSPIPGPDLRINMSVNKTVGNPGETVTYTITYKNVGTDAATNANIRFELPTGLTWLSEAYPAGGTPSGAVAGPGLRNYAFAAIPADGVEYTITVTAVLNGADAGTHVYYNQAAINCTEKPVYVESDPPALIFAVNRDTGAWKSYGVWDDNPPALAGQNLGFLHIYGLRDGTTVNLYRASSNDTSGGPVTINTLETTQAMGAGGVIDVPLAGTREYRIEANYPVLWEFDSRNLPDRAGHSMEPYSTDYKLADNKAFMTHMYQYEKTGCGTPDCPNTPKVGDVLGIINTSLTTQAEVVIYQSLDNGATWNYMGNLTVAPESVYLYGGTTQAMAGDYIAVSVGDYTTNGGEKIIVYKGSEIGLDPYWNTNDKGMNYAVSEKGQKADNSRLYGTCSTSTGNVVVTGVSGSANYTIYRYVPDTGVSTSWPVTGNSGTWTSVATGSVSTGTTSVHTVGQKGFYKIAVTSGGGNIQAAMGGTMMNDQGDGDYVGSADNLSQTGYSSPSNYTHLDIGRDFYIGTDGRDGLIEVIMPESGTSITLTGPAIRNYSQGFGEYWTSMAPPASTVNDQVYKFYTQGNNSTYRIISNKNVIVQWQGSLSSNQGIAKAFAGSPLFIAVVMTPTSTATSTPTPSGTPSRTPTQTNTPSRTPSATPTATPSGTPTGTATQTPTVTASRTHTQTNTPSGTATPANSSTNTPTRTPTFTSTETGTPTRTPTDTNTPVPTFTVTDTVSSNTPTVTRTGTDTYTATPTLTLSGTPTATATGTATGTVSLTLTPSGTRTYTPTATGTRTITETPTDTAPASPTHSPTVSATGTASMTNTPLPSATGTPSITRTGTPSMTDTPLPSATPTWTVTRTDTTTRTPTSTRTATPTRTDTPVPAPVSLEINITATGDNPAIGAKIYYTITVHNTTPYSVYDPVIWDTLPSNLSYLGYNGGVSPVVNGNYILFDLAGTTLNADDSVSFEIVVEILSLTSGALIPNSAGTDYYDDYFLPGTVRHPPVFSTVYYWPEDIIVVYPNPYNPLTAVGGTLKFINVVPDNLIRIYTLSGEEVYVRNATGLREEWNGRNRYDSPVSPGIYYWTVYNKTSKQLSRGKLYIINN